MGQKGQHKEIKQNIINLPCLWECVLFTTSGRGSKSISDESGS